MPVSTLLVEGTLDVAVLTAVLSGAGVVIVPGGSKYGLPPQARNRRQAVPEQVSSYLRDRDFHSDPPTDASEPIVDRLHDGHVLGWRWCRHEIENYLIDPELVAVASGWDKDQYRAQLVSAACRIRHYQIARWVIGNVRRNLPPQYD